MSGLMEPEWHSICGLIQRNKEKWAEWLQHHLIQFYLSLFLAPSKVICIEVFVANTFPSICQNPFQIRVLYFKISRFEITGARIGSTLPPTVRTVERQCWERRWHLGCQQASSPPPPPLPPPLQADATDFQKAPVIYLWLRWGKENEAFQIVHKAVDQRF